MLPGVEVARRRRIRGGQGRDLDAYDGGLGVVLSETHRSRPGSVTTVVQHHHHVHHQRHSSNAPRPGTPRPGSLVRRMQVILQEHRFNSSVHHVRSAARGQTAYSSISSHSGRSFGGNRSGEESRGTSLSSLWRRAGQSSSSEMSNELRGAAIEARNRLDERLRAAVHATQRRNGQTQPSHDMNLLFSDDEDDNLWSDDDGWETSLHEWLAAWAPSLEERWNRVEPQTSRSNGSRSVKPKPSEGLSKADINALPREIVRPSVGMGKWEQADCPVCLEGILTGELVMTLSCKHRFHPHCLTPWLASHKQCPYCRANIRKENPSSELQCNRLLDSNEDLLSWVEVIDQGMGRLRYS